MSLLSRVEGMFEGIFEGGVRRLFRPQLQPVEISYALERAMTAAKVVASASIDVPNTYRARISPADFERLRALLGTIEHDSAAYLERRARELGFHPIGTVHVTVESDPAVSRSFVRANGIFDEATKAPFVGSLAHTRRLDPVPAARSSVSGMLLVAEDGRELRLADRPIKLGRAVDNDFVIRDVRVSRHHAVIEPSGRGWVVKDLESTNGTYVDGQRVEQTTIDTPTEISLGGCRLVPRR